MTNGWRAPLRLDDCFRACLDQGQLLRCDLFGGDYSLIKQNGAVADAVSYY
jgi:hypothetical protein